MAPARPPGASRPPRHGEAGRERRERESGIMCLSGMADDRGDRSIEQRKEGAWHGWSRERERGFETAAPARVAQVAQIKIK